MTPDPLYEPGEPQVFCEDVARIVRPYADRDNGEAADMLAERSGYAPRTLWRVLSCEGKYLSLKLADHVLVACGRSIRECRLLLADGTIEYPYDD